MASRLGRVRTVTAGLLIAAAANGLVFLGVSSLLATAIGILLLGFGFMTAHSTLITVATEFAARARGTAMSLVTFAFMVGGAVGTQIGGHIAGAATFNTMYAVYGAGLLLLGLAALPALGAAGAAAAAGATEPA